MGAEISKNQKSVKNGLKHPQTTLESQLVGYEDDWNGSERSDFLVWFLDFCGILRYFEVFEYVTKIGPYLETRFSEKKKCINFDGKKKNFSMRHIFLENYYLEHK